MVLLYVKENYLLWLGIPAILGVMRRKFWSEKNCIIAGMLLIGIIWAVLSPCHKFYHRQLLLALVFFYIFVIGAFSQFSTFKPVRISSRIYCILIAVVILFCAQATRQLQTFPNPLVERLTSMAKSPARYVAEIGRIIVNPDNYSEEVTALFHNQHLTYNNQALVGKFIGLNYPAGTTLVYDQMGQTPWYAGLDKTFIDATGLTDRLTGIYVFHGRARGAVYHLYNIVMDGIAELFWPDETRVLKNKEQVSNHIFNARPDVIMIHTFLSLFTPRSRLSRIEKDYRLRENYRPVYLVNKIARIYERKEFKSREPAISPEGCTVEKLKSFP